MTGATGGGALGAGEGASEQARLAADRASVLERQLEQARRRQRAWEAGAEGERWVAETLRALEGHGWRLLHDVRWPGRPRANLDHVLVGPGGVIVLDTKNWSGRVEVSRRATAENGYARDRAVEAVLESTAAVAALLAVVTSSARRRHDLHGRPAPDLAGTSANGVAVVGIEKLVPQILALRHAARSRCR